jgi:hypothetical protein
MASVSKKEKAPYGAFTLGVASSRDIDCFSSRLLRCAKPCHPEEISHASVQVRLVSLGIDERHVVEVVHRNIFGVPRNFRRIDSHTRSERDCCWGREQQ